MDFQVWLPLELWTMTFQTIADTSPWPTRLNNVRLTCKLFARLAAPFLLPRIICGPLSNPLATLTAVSRHPAISRSVTEFIYTCNQYRFIESLSDYKVALRRASTEFVEPNSEEENIDLNKAFLQYRQQYNDQTALQKYDEVIGTLCCALMRMPNVKKIAVSPKYYCCEAKEISSRYFLGPEPEYNETFLLLARVLSFTGAKIRKFSIQSLEGYGGIDGAVFGGMSQSNLSHCYNAFCGLREVSITATKRNVDGWMTRNLPKILSGAANLETLRFNGCSGESFPISTEFILSTTTWSQLTSLTLVDTCVDQKDFLDLLTRHSGTLKIINLCVVGLTDGLWKILLEGMKSSLSLRDIDIDSPYEKDNEHNEIEIYWDRNALMSYLLGDGPHPLQNDCLGHSVPDYNL